MPFDTAHFGYFDVGDGPIDPDTLPQVRCGGAGGDIGPHEIGTARDRLHAYLKQTGDNAVAKIDTIMAHPLMNAHGDVERLSTRALWVRAARLGLVRV